MVHLLFIGLERCVNHFQRKGSILLGDSACPEKLDLQPCAEVKTPILGSEGSWLQFGPHRSQGSWRSTLGVPSTVPAHARFLPPSFCGGSLLCHLASAISGVRCDTGARPRGIRSELQPSALCLGSRGRAGVGELCAAGRAQRWGGTKETHEH